MQFKDYASSLMRSGKNDLLIAELQTIRQGKEVRFSIPEKIEIPSEDEIAYLLGNAYYKKGDWKEAIQYYLKACELNPSSLASEKLKMAYCILEFYNKDVFGQ